MPDDVETWGAGKFKTVVQLKIEMSNVITAVKVSRGQARNHLPVLGTGQGPNKWFVPTKRRPPKTDIGV